MKWSDVKEARKKSRDGFGEEAEYYGILMDLRYTIENYRRILNNGSSFSGFTIQKVLNFIHDEEINKILKRRNLFGPVELYVKNDIIYNMIRLSRKRKFGIVEIGLGSLIGCNGHGVHNLLTHRLFPVYDFACLTTSYKTLVLCDDFDELEDYTPIQHIPEYEIFFTNENEDGESDIKVLRITKKENS